MRIFLLLLVFYCCQLSVVAQTLKGRVADKTGEPVVGATLFVRELSQGSVTDDNGEFQLTLNPGHYTCEISSMGFEKQVRQVQMGKGRTVLNVQLEPAVYMLKEVKVVANGEDPAYYIMRKAIARAPFHRNQVKAYTSEVYTKGTMKLDKIPRLLTLGAAAKKEIKPLIGKLFLLESVMEVRFKAPDVYERKVVAFSSTIPDDMDPKEALNIITASIYDPAVMGLVSPLAPGAFSYYRFRFVDCYVENGRTINKIRVEPRKDNSKQVDGWLYIAEDQWGVVYFDLTTTFMGITAHIKSGFNEVKPTVFLPTSYDITVDVKLLGIKAGGKYYSSIKYKEVEAIGIEEPLAEAVAVKPVTEKSRQRQKAAAQLEKLSQKEKLSNREAYRLARLAQQTMEPERSDTLPPLEMKPYAANDRVTVDTMATRRDSLYWLQMRTLPLKTEEEVSYLLKDSMRKVMSVIYQDTTGQRGNEGRILMGGSFRMGKKWHFALDGLIRAVPEYNFVDGFWVGQGFDQTVHFNKRQRLTISPSFYFATARKTLIWKVASQFNYAPLRRGELSLEFGDVSADYNRSNGAWRFENTMTSLVCGDNFMKFYGKRFFQLKNRVELATGLIFSVGGAYEKRQVLQNHIAYNFFGKEGKTNSPLAEGGVEMPDNTATHAFVQLDYTPRLYYQVREGEKKYHHTDYPTFSIRYEQGIPNGAQFSSSYSRLSAGIGQYVPLGVFDYLSYSVLAGKFLAKEELYFPDYKHFNTTGWILNGDQFAAGYFLADYYRLSTDKEWLQGAINYTSTYLLLKRLPFLQHFLFNEAVHVRYLWTREQPHYTEWGYSLGVGDIGRLGVFVGFDKRTYQGIGVRVSLPISILK